MPTRREHNKDCQSKGISAKVCEETNQYMDAPAKEGGGCAHREQRHRTVDCVVWAAKSAANPKEAVDRYHACHAHREADKKTDRCGSESLKE